MIGLLAAIVHRGEETSIKDANLIICSDCVYDMAPWDLLVDSLRLLCRGDDCRILISMEHRHKHSEEKFWNYAAEHFDVVTVPHVRRKKTYFNNKNNHDLPLPCCVAHTTKNKLQEEHDADFSADDIDLYILSSR